MLSNVHCSSESSEIFHRKLGELHQLSADYLASLHDQSREGIEHTKAVFADYMTSANLLINDQLRPLKEGCFQAPLCPSECSTSPPPPINQDDSWNILPRVPGSAPPLVARWRHQSPSTFREEDVLALGNRDEPSGCMELHRRISLKFMYNEQISEEELSQCSPAFFKHLQRMLLIYRGKVLDIS
jgi:hypothetical protein